MLLFSLVAYLVVTIFIGVITSRFVKTSEDFIIAGRRLPFLISSAALFATWFGSETILGASSEFVSHGLYGVIEDPFGAALCLFLIGVFFARPIYKMNLVTFGDFYKKIFGRKTEMIAGFFMVPSYFGWIAAQLVALGILINVVAGIPTIQGILFSAIIVTAYTYIGGMWAVSITDFIQTIVIIAGLILLAVSLVGEAGGLMNIYQQTPEGFFKFFPDPDPANILKYFAAWITIGLGSIPQQDVFQRVMASKDSKTAVRASYFSSFLYMSVGFLPLLIGLCAKILYPDILTGDAQTVLPKVVLLHSNIFIQIMFFGALFSAIMSTTSGAILAPASILSENLIKPLLKNKLEKKHHLSLVRACVVIIAVISTGMACVSTNIYELVAQSSVLSLVSLFIPMAGGLYWKRSSSTGAIFSMVAGISVWAFWENFGDPDFPALIAGLIASLAGIVAGSLLVPDRKNNAEVGKELEDKISIKTLR